MSTSTSGDGGSSAQPAVAAAQTQRRNQRGGGGSGRRRRARSRGGGDNNRTRGVNNCDDPRRGASSSQVGDEFALASNTREHLADESQQHTETETETLLGATTPSTFTQPAQQATRAAPTGQRHEKYADEQQQQQQHELERPLLSPPTTLNDAQRSGRENAPSRKPSAAAKPVQMSVCSGSQASSALGTSRRSSASCLGLDQTTSPPADGAGEHNRKYKKLHDKLTQRKCSSSTMDLSFKSPPSLQQPSLIRPLSASGRTISQSMLELDQELASREFRVYWRDLNFAYERPWLARTLAKVGPRLGLTSASATNCPQAQLESGSQGSSRGNLVLRSLSGSFRSNQLVAIIGPSGCGKTTLLQFLAGNNSSQRRHMRIAGLAEPKVAYIGQDDALLPGLTARETLMFASRLQNTRADFDHRAHIQPILSELGLSECADRNVSKLSGGQAKRVTIAQELLYPTNLLILDEVTSGLDASTSYSIVKLLKYLVSDRSYPMSIVMSIHQPSARLFSVFDRVYAMSEGQCLYEGSCEPAAINARLGRFQLECPRYHNIADYLIELACCTTGDDEQESLVGGTKYLSLAVREQMIAYQRSLSRNDDDDDGEEMQEQQQLIDTSETRESQMNGKRSELVVHFGDHEKLDTPTCDNAHLQVQSPRADKEDDQSLYQAIEQARKLRLRPLGEHFQVHLKRSLVRIKRSYILTYLQLITYILLGLQLATFYGSTIGTLSGCPRLPSNLMSYVLTSGGTDDTSVVGSQQQNGTDGPDEEAEDELTSEMRRIQENMNFLLVTVMTATFAALEITVITFPLEAKTIKREWRNGWYRVSSYFMGRTLADLPFQLAFVLIFCLLIYVMTGQLGLGTWRFGSFVATITMTALIAQSFGFIFGALFMDNLPAAVFTAPLAIFPALLFSGFFSRVSQIPAFYKPMTYLSHFRYAFDALLVTLYGYERCACDQVTLTQYHANLRNQTSSMRDMFGILFGASDCLSGTSAAAAPADLSPNSTPWPPGGAASANEISHEDLAAIRASNATLASQMLQSMTTNAGGVSMSTSTLGPLATAAPAHTNAFKPLEDALIESVFDQMNQNNGLAEMTTDSTTGGGGGETSVMDRLADKFSTRLTTMLNKHSNFGHQVPRECNKFNSYLMTEFDLRNEDLIFGLAMLFLVLVITRLLCNCILNFTIATRAK